MIKNNKDYQDRISKYLCESAEVKNNTAKECLNSIQKAVQLIINTFKIGNKVMICGNGGSAADAQHMAGEFVCTLNKNFKRPGLPAIALTTNTSVLTAYANDFQYKGVFKRQIQALGQHNDLLIGISTSGNSENVIEAFKMAKLKGLKILALTGKNGVLLKMADIAISVPSLNSQYLQEAFLSIEHILCEIVEDDLFYQSQKERSKL